MRYFDCPNAIVLDVKGPHAQRYLQSRLTNDVRLATNTRAIEAAALNAQGRVLAMFVVFKVADNEFRLICDGGDQSEIVSALKQFIVSERVEVLDQSSVLSVVHFADADISQISNFPPPPLKALEVSSRADTCIIARKRVSNAGFDVILSLEAGKHLGISLATLGFKELSASEKALGRLNYNLPAFPEELNAEHILLEAGPSDRISFTKGCYVGQEVIARIDSLGKPPSILSRLWCDGGPALPAGAQIRASGPAIDSKVVGSILTTAFEPHGNKTLFFAYLRNLENLDQLSFEVLIEGSWLPAQLFRTPPEASKQPG